MEYTALIKIAGVEIGEHSFSIMQSEHSTNYIHINNFKTHKNSVILREAELRKALGILANQLESR